MAQRLNWALWTQIRGKATITSFKQWKDLLVFKRHDGKHVWNLPKFIPHEFGFRRIARKPPFFKQRKFVFPPITRDQEPGRDVLYHRSLYVKYGWENRAREFHELKEYMNRRYKGVNVVGIPTAENTLQVLDEEERVLLDLKSVRDIDSIFKS